MTTTTIAHSLTFMFKDEDWFWKVSLGALALLLTGVGIGYFLVIGYHVETVRRCRTSEPSLPEWNRLRPLLHTGWIVGSAMLCYSVLVLGCLTAVHRASLLNAGIAVVVIHTFVLPFAALQFLEAGTLTSCFALRSFAAVIRRTGLRALTITSTGFGIVVIVLCFGWMALIVGWPFFIFWGMLAAAARTAGLAPAPYLNEAASQ
jgi:hypothetical protein